MIRHLAERFGEREVIALGDRRLSYREAERQSALLARGLLASGVATEEIASTLGVSRSTARNHIESILAKLGVHSRLQAVVYASRRGLL